MLDLYQREKRSVLRNGLKRLKKTRSTWTKVISFINLSIRKTKRGLDLQDKEGIHTLNLRRYTRVIQKTRKREVQSVLKYNIVSRRYVDTTGPDHRNGVHHPRERIIYP